MAMPVESSNKSLRPLLAAGGAGVGEGAKVFGTDDGIKFCPTCNKNHKRNNTKAQPKSHFKTRHRKRNKSAKNLRNWSERKSQSRAKAEASDKAFVIMKKNKRSIMSRS